MRTVSMYRRWAVMLLALFVFFNLTACTLSPKNPSEVLFYSKYNIAGIYKSIALLREADRITKSEGVAFFEKANEAESAVMTAQVALEAGDKATFAEKMAVASKLLLTVQNQLNEKMRTEK